MTELASTTSPFSLICEIRPPTRPDLAPVRLQVAHLQKSADAFLIPENPIGLATISSIAVASEVASLGSTAIACLNARDRNVLGFRRDLLSAAVSGVRELLFVRGDAVSSAPRSGLTVQKMIEEVRNFSVEFDNGPTSIGVTCQLEPLPDWKREADRIFLQASFSLHALLDWREQNAFDGPVCAGIIVPPSLARALRWSAELPGIDVPKSWIHALAKDPLAGVELACDLAEAIEQSGAFDAIHLISGVRYPEVAERLTAQARSAIMAG